MVVSGLKQIYLMDITSGNMYTVYDTKASNYYQESNYSQVTFWKCDECNTIYSDTGGEIYNIATDYNSFEGDISWWQCKTNCYHIWDNG